jgi:hypothetical protein
VACGLSDWAGTDWCALVRSRSVSKFGLDTGPRVPSPDACAAGNLCGKGSARPSAQMGDGWKPIISRDQLSLGRIAGLGGKSAVGEGFGLAFAFCCAFSVALDTLDPNETCIVHTPDLFTKPGELLRKDYDWSGPVHAIKCPTILVFADANGVRSEHIFSSTKSWAAAKAVIPFYQHQRFP